MHVLPTPLERAAHLLDLGDPLQRNDPSADASLRAHAAELDLPEGLSLRWLGTAGFALEYRGTRVLIDPYLSRPGLREVVSGRRLRPDIPGIDRWVGDADAILVGHTHFDHALDIPYLAWAHDATVYGSSSLRKLMTLHGLQSRSVLVRPGHRYEVGELAITFVHSCHSKLMLGLAVPAGGELTCDHLDHLSGRAFRCGQVYGIHIEVAGRTFYHQGSANLVDDALRRQCPGAGTHGVDYFLCGIAGRRFTDRYLERILPVLKPRLIIPHHYDDFFRPLDQAMGFSLNVNLGGFVEEVRSVSDEFQVRTLPRVDGVPVA
jgi:L-ascorbate metabolism protein UlaG (beta-lactamase superfamily)